MMLPGAVLVIENATDLGSVAVLSGEAVLAAVEFPAYDPASGARSEGLGLAVAKCMAIAGVTVADLTSVVCGAGPGGFTSLRIGAAAAKGLCSALSIPLFAISSLELMAWSTALPRGEYVVAIGAARGDWFISMVRCDAQGGRDVSAAWVVSADELRDLKAVRNATLVGAGLDIDAHPTASAALACIERMQLAGPVSLDRWEPDYGRLAEAQVKWEAAHGRSLPV